MLNPVQENEMSKVDTDLHPDMYESLLDNYRSMVARMFRIMKSQHAHMENVKNAELQLAEEEQQLWSDERKRQSQLETESLDSRVEELQHYQSLASHLEKQNKEQNEKLNSLRAELENEKEFRQSSEQKAAQSAAEIDSLKRQLEHEKQLLAEAKGRRDSQTEEEFNNLNARFEQEPKEKQTEEQGEKLNSLSIDLENEKELRQSSEQKAPKSAAEIDSLKQLLEDEKHSRSELEKRLESQTEEFNNLKARFEEKSNELENEMKLRQLSERKAVESAAEIDSLQRQLDDEKHSRFEVESSLASQTEEFNNLKSRLEEKSNELENKEELWQSTEQKAAESAVEIDSMKRQLEDEKLARSEVQRRLEFQTEELHNLKACFEEKSNELENETKLRQSSEQKASESAAEIDSLKQQLEDEKQSRLEVERRFDSQTHELNKFEARLEEKSQEIQDLTLNWRTEKRQLLDENADISAKLQNAMGDVEALQKEPALRQSYEQKATDSAAEIESLKQQLEGEKQSRSEVESRLNSKTQELYELRKEVTRLNAENTRLQEHLQDREASNVDSSKVGDESVCENASLKAEVSFLKEQLSHSDFSAHNASEELSSIKHRKNELSRKVDELSRELNESQYQNRTLSLHNEQLKDQLEKEKIHTGIAIEKSTDINALYARIEETESKIDEQDRIIKSLRSEKFKLLGSLDTLRNESDHLASTLGKVFASYEKDIRNLASLEDKMSSVTTNIHDQAEHGMQTGSDGPSTPQKEASPYSLDYSCTPQSKQLSFSPETYLSPAVEYGRQVGSALMGEFNSITEKISSELSKTVRHARQDMLNADTYSYLSSHEKQLDKEFRRLASHLLSRTKQLQKVRKALNEEKESSMAKANKISELQHEITRLQEALNNNSSVASEAENSCYSTNAEESTESVQSYKNLAEMRRKQIESLEDELKMIHSECQRHYQQRSSLESDMREVEGERDQLREMVDNLRSQKEVASTKFDALVSLLDKTSRYIDKHQSALNVLVQKGETNHSRPNKRLAFEGNLESIVQVCNNLEPQLEIFFDTIEMVEKEFEKQGEQASSENQKVGKLSKTIDDKEEELTHLKEKAHELRSVKRQLSEYVDEVETLRAKNKGLYNRLVQTSEELDSLQTKSVMWQSELTNVSHEKSSIEGETSRHQQAAKQQKIRADKAEGKVSELQEQTSKLTTRVSSLKGELCGKEEECERLQNEVKKWKDKYDALNTELTSVSSFHTQEKTEMKEKLSEISEEKEYAKSQLESYAGKLQQKMEEMDTVKHEYEDRIKSLSESLNENKAQYEEQLKSSKDEINRLQAELRKQMHMEVESAGQQHKKLEELQEIVEEKNARLMEYSKKPSINDEISSVVSQLKDDYQQMEGSLRACECNLSQEQSKLEETSKQLAEKQRSLLYMQNKAETYKDLYEAAAKKPSSSGYLRGRSDVSRSLGDAVQRLQTALQNINDDGSVTISAGGSYMCAYGKLCSVLQQVLASIDTRMTALDGEVNVDSAENVPETPEDTNIRRAAGRETSRLVRKLMIHRDGALEVSFRSKDSPDQSRDSEQHNVSQIVKFLSNDGNQKCSSYSASEQKSMLLNIAQLVRDGLSAAGEELESSMTSNQGSSRTSVRKWIEETCDILQTAQKSSENADIHSCPAQGDETRILKSEVAELRATVESQDYYIKSLRSQLSTLQDSRDRLDKEIRMKEASARQRGMTLLGELHSIIERCRAAPSEDDTKNAGSNRIEQLKAELDNTKALADAAQKRCDALERAQSMPAVKKAQEVYAEDNSLDSSQLASMLDTSFSTIEKETTPNEKMSVSAKTSYVRNALWKMDNYESLPKGFHGILNKCKDMCDSILDDHEKALDQKEEELSSKRQFIEKLKDSINEMKTRHKELREDKRKLKEQSKKSEANLQYYKSTVNELQNQLQDYRQEHEQCQHSLSAKNKSINKYRRTVKAMMSVVRRECGRTVINLLKDKLQSLRAGSTEPPHDAMWATSGPSDNQYSVEDTFSSELTRLDGSTTIEHDISTVNPAQYPTRRSRSNSLSTFPKRGIEDVTKTASNGAQRCTNNYELSTKELKSMLDDAVRRENYASNRGRTLAPPEACASVRNGAENRSQSLPPKPQNRRAQTKPSPKIPWKYISSSDEGVSAAPKPGRGVSETSPVRAVSAGPTRGNWHVMQAVREAQKASKAVSTFTRPVDESVPSTPPTQRNSRGQQETDWTQVPIASNLTKKFASAGASLRARAEHQAI